MDLRLKINKILANFNDYLLFLSCLTIIIGALVYYLYSFNKLGLSSAIILIIIAFLGLKKYFFTAEAYSINYLILNKKYYVFTLIYLILAGAALATLWLGRSSRPLISPWEVVSVRFFIFYSLASLALVFILIKKEFSSTGKLFLLGLHYFISLSIAAIVYKIGYGFDPFIHQASMELIAQGKIVAPKVPYYLGQYSFIIIASKITGLSIYLLNKFLISVLAAIFIPTSLYRFLKNSGGSLKETPDQLTNSNQAANFLTILFLLTLTFSPFIITTPQNLTYLFLLLTVLSGLSLPNWRWTLLLALTTFSIHPLSGLPALLFTAYIIVQKNKEKLKIKTFKLLKFLIFALNVLALPLALFLTSGHKLKKLSLQLHLSFNSAGREDFFLNIIYFFYNNYSILLGILILASLIYFYRQKSRPAWANLITINLSLLGAYLLSGFINFTSLISYEQGDYPARLLIIIIIFCLPEIIFLIRNLISKIIIQTRATQIIWLIFGLCFLSTSLYLSYPRFDKYFNARGYSVSNNDLLAVREVDKTSLESSYIALANQQVGVAALKEFGFDHYYPTALGPVYFYSIPTGGPLYQYYLDMVYKNPSRATILQALDLAGVKIGYLIINKYWHDSGRIINEAKLSADNWSDINKEVYIFQYKR